MEEKLKEYYSKLLDMYNRANTLSKKIRIGYDLMTFYDVYSGIFPDEKIAWENDKELDNLLQKDDDRSTNIYLQKLFKYRDIYSNIFDASINTFIDANYPFYKYNCINYLKSFHKISKKDLYDIMFSFLNSYDSNLYHNFKEKIDNYEIFYSDNIAGYDGSTNNINCLNKSFIILNDDLKDCVYLAKTMMHEFGHTYENKLYNNRSGFLDSYDTNLYEISSSFFEYSFLRYLKENKIYEEDSNKCLDLYYKELFFNSIDFNTLLKYLKKFNSYDELELVSNELLTICDEELLDKKYEIFDKVNYFKIGYDNNDLSIINDVIYPIGQLYSIYLYNNYMENKEYFKKEFERSLLSYPHGNLNSFDKLVNIEDLINGNILKKELKKI